MLKTFSEWSILTYMHIQDVNDKDLWEGFLENVEKKTFLHSWAWGDFQKLLGERVWRFGVYEEQALVAIALVIKIKACRGSFLFIPQGPIIQNPKFEILQELTSELKELAKQERCSFIRISPIVEDTEEHREIFGNLGFRSAPMHMHAELTWVLGIAKREEELLQGMRKTTRNLIRRGEREGVEVIKGSLDEFYPMFEKTARRQGFVRFSRDYFQKELEIFHQSPLFHDREKENIKGVQDGQIFLAKYQGEILAGAFIVFYADTAYYHHGASLHSSVPAAYTLQWEIIKEAKKRAMKQYNFWGVVPESDTNHPWWGLSLFKRGFGGREWNLLHAQDLPLSWKYYISWSIEKLRKWRRGY